MKRPPSPSCSSLSSSVGLGISDQSLKSKPKPSKKHLKPATKICKQNNNNSSSSGKGRTSIYKGVTKHKHTGKYEARLWDKSSWNSTKNKKGIQVFLGICKTEEEAARTYDLGALKYWGLGTTLNFLVDSYTEELKDMENFSRDDYMALLRRQTDGFSRGASGFRGVFRHHNRWEARFGGRANGDIYMYLGIYGTAEEAARAYDRAVIILSGPKAKTNFDISNYTEEIRRFLKLDPIQQQQEQHQIVSDQFQCTQNPCMEASLVGVMNPVVDHGSSLLDPGFDQPEVPDLPLDESRDLLDVFDADFELDNFDFSSVDDILDSPCPSYGDVIGASSGFSFETDCNFIDFNVDDILDSPCPSPNHEDVVGASECFVRNNRHDGLLSSASRSSSQSSSPTTSVSGNYFP